MIVETETTGEVRGLLQLSGWRKESAGPTELEDCTLVVPTYQRPAILVGLLERLAELPDAPGEVVVVDGSPVAEVGKAVAAWARSRELRFVLVYVKSPKGLTRQRNVGVDVSTGKYMFFLDDDCLPHPGYFRTLREVFAKDAQEEVGAVCGSIVNEMGKPVSLRWRVRFLLRLVPRGESGKYYPTATSVPRCLVAPFRGTRPVDMIPGGAAAYRREVFRYHRFSLFFDGYAQGEDFEMSMRVGRQWKLLWCGDAHVAHCHAAGGRPPSVTKGRMEVRNRFFIWKRCSPDVRWMDRLRFWLDIAYVFACDLASFVAHPRQRGNLAHAAGVARGAIECLLSPPRYEEPPPRMEYQLRAATVTDP